MINRFKLIKEYPGSGSLGQEIYYTSGAWFIDSGNSFSFLSSTQNPEKYPEFWEKVIPKEHEILSFKATSDKPYTLGNDGLYRNGDSYFDGDGTLRSLEYLLQNLQVYKIHSVKRLSDGEVFTIGDKNNNGKIESFILGTSTNPWGGGIGINYGYNHTEALSIATKQKPLTKTEDGVDVYEKDKVAWAIKYMGKSEYAYAYNLEVTKGHLDMFRIHPDTYKLFSTKEAAEKWCEENKHKPLFRTEDNVDIYDGTEYYYVYPITGWKVSSMTATLAGKYNSDTPNDKIYRFSTEAKAEEYILWNKPCITGKDALTLMSNLDSLDTKTARLKQLLIKATK